MENMTTAQLSDWARLAIQYGPFFFSLLFLLILPRWIHKIVSKARKEEERLFYRKFFFVSLIFGMLLVIASVVWWFLHYPFSYVFQGEIRKLESYEEISSESFYFKPVWVKIGDEKDLQIRHEQFMIAQSKQFEENQEFSIWYCKEGGRPEEFKINYEPDTIPKYEILWNSSEGRNVLVKLNPKPTPPSYQSSLLGVAYAGEPEESAFGDSISILQPVPAQIDQRLVRLLQDERTDVGSKIEALDNLESLSDELLKRYIEFITPKEPMVLTLLDLSRHSDKELSYKAGKIVNKRFNLDEYLGNSLISNNQTIRERAETILFRMEKERVMSILRKIPADHETQWIQNLKREVNAGRRTRVLVPTGSATGDRYYILVEWNPINEVVVDCLAKLFDREFLYSTFEGKTEILKNQKERWIYDESKEWALRIADEIIACGGKARFLEFPR